MSALTTIPAVAAAPEILAPAGEAYGCDLNLRRAAKALKTSLMEIAYYGWRLKRTEGWLELGYEDETAYRHSLDIPKSTYFKFIRIGEALQQLSLDDMKALSTGNAELLLQVPPELWHDFPWVMEAKKLPTPEFAMRITTRSEQSGSDRVPMTYFRVRVPFLAKDALEEMVDNFRSKHGLASAGQALELLIADQYDRPNLLSTIYTCKYQIREAITELSRPVVRPRHRLKYCAVLEAAWRTLNEVWKKEGSEEILPGGECEDPS